MGKNNSKHRALRRARWQAKQIAMTQCPACNESVVHEKLQDYMANACWLRREPPLVRWWNYGGCWHACRMYPYGRWVAACRQVHQRCDGRALGCLKERPTSAHCPSCAKVLAKGNDWLAQPH